MIDKYLFKQVFSVAVAVILLVTFYILLAIDMTTPTQNFITPMILIIISITVLAIFSEIVNIEENIIKTVNKSKKGGGRK